MKIITGVGENDHVTPNDFRNILIGIWGSGSFILDTGEEFQTNLVSNNQLDIGTGMMCCEGHISTEVEGASIVIANGTQGMKRRDLVVNRYQRNDATQIETNSWVYIMGTADASNPVTPEYTEGNIMAGDLVVDCPVFEISIDGLSVTDVKCLLPVMKNIAKDQETQPEESADTGWITPKLTDKFRAYNSEFTPVYRKIGKQVEVMGAVAPINAISATDEPQVIFTLPEGFRPRMNIAKRAQGSGLYTWLCTIETNGNVGFSRYGNMGSNSYAAASSSAFLPFEETYFVD